MKDRDGEPEAQDRATTPARIYVDNARWLKAIADHRGCTMADVVSELLIHLVEEMRQVHKVQGEDLARMEKKKK